MVSISDAGLPPGQTRDDAFNTNNFTERAFRTFTNSFLAHTKNKRVDTLVLRLFEFFDFYTVNENNDCSVDQDIVREAELGWVWWRAGLV